VRVELTRVLLKQVGRRQVAAAAKPRVARDLRGRPGARGGAGLGGRGAVQAARARSATLPLPPLYLESGLLKRLPVL
jgi:hypothetical protein